MDYVLESLATVVWGWPIEVQLELSLDEARRRIAPDMGTLEPTRGGVLLRTQADALDFMARFLVQIDCPFRVLHPPELRDAVRQLAKRLTRYARRSERSHLTRHSDDERRQALSYLWVPANGSAAYCGAMLTRWGAAAAVIAVMLADEPDFAGRAAGRNLRRRRRQAAGRRAGGARSARARPVRQAYDQAVHVRRGSAAQWGYPPSLQTFPVTDLRRSRLAARGDFGRARRCNVPADTLQYSVGGQLQAPLVAAGLGPGSGFGRRRCARQGRPGRSAACCAFPTRWQRRGGRCRRRASSTTIAAGSVQGSLLEAGARPGGDDFGRQWPAVVGLLAGGPVSVQLLRSTRQTEQRSGTNVVAELPGSRADAGTVIFTAHLDSVPAGPGANDNGSGSAVVLELAHELAQRSPAERPMTVRFALFGAEELGLFGSRYYVQSLTDAERQAIRADVNLDMVGVGDAWRFGGTDDLVQLRARRRQRPRRSARCRCAARCRAPAITPVSWTQASPPCSCTAPKTRTTTPPATWHRWSIRTR